MRNLFFLALFIFTASSLLAQPSARTGAQSSGTNGTATKPVPQTVQPVAAKTETARTTKKPSTASVEQRGTGTTPPTKRTVTPAAKEQKIIPARTAKTTPKTEAPKAPLKPAVAPEKVKWYTIEEAIAKSATEKRKIFVDVYTDWCGWCKRMDETTFTNPDIVRYLNDKYYAVKFNAEQTGDVTYKGKVYKFKKEGDRGVHELAALWLNNRLSYPTVAVLDEEQTLIQSIPGYQEATKLDVILHYFGTDNHKKTPWEKYERNYGKE